MYIGDYIPNRCCTSRPDSSSDVDLSGGSSEPAQWDVSKKEQDDIFLEFKYKTIKGTDASSDHKIIMLLDTVDKDSSNVYDQARKMVSSSSTSSTSTLSSLSSSRLVSSVSSTVNCMPSLKNPKRRRLTRRQRRS